MKAPTRQSLASIAALIRPERRRFAGVLLLAAVAAFAESVGLGLIAVTLSTLVGGGTNPAGSSFGFMRAIEEHARSSPGTFFAALGLAYVVRGVLSLVANYVAIALALRVADGWRLRVLRGLLHASSRKLPDKQGHLLQLVIDEPAIAGTGLSAAGIMVQNVVAALAVYGTLLLLSPATTAVLTVVAVMAMGVLMLIFRISRRIAERREGVVSAAYGYLTEALSAIRQIRLFGLESMVERTAEARLTEMRHINRGSLVISSSPRVALELVFVLGFAIVIAVWGQSAGKEEVISGAGLAVIAAMRLLPSFSAAAGTWVQIQLAIPALARIEATLRDLEGASEVTGGKGEVLPPLSRAVQFQRVGFSYPGRPQILKDVDLEIPKGSFVALVGPSGSGKSTLLDLLTRLHTADAGEILVDGRPLVGADVWAWRQQLGVVSQDGFLMHGTVRENLVLLRPETTDAELRAAVASVGADAIIADLPQGYDTIIGERGVSLSGGQRQRLALVRVLLRRPRILVLDEATSALDAESDEAVYRTIAALKGHMTIVAVAHRIRSIQRADRIYVLQDGRVVETGRHDELLARGGLYALLATTGEGPAGRADPGVASPPPA